jgi:molybdopterin/thiamine biosynthesis adenylyltransferase
VTQALLAGVVAEAISSSGVSWGHLDLRYDVSEDLVVVVGYSKAEKVKLPVRAAWLDEHYSRAVSVTPAAGFWYRADLELHLAGEWASRRQSVVPLAYFKERVRGFRQPHRVYGTFAITVCDIDGQADFAGWVVTIDAAIRFHLELVDDAADVFSPLGEAWPREVLAEKLVTVVGIGSIGSAACEALSGYALRRFALVDPDRLEAHNFAHHRAHPRDLGRYKVNAVAMMLTERDSGASVERFPLNVIDDADVMRPLFQRSNCILVCSDGVASRRVANHLACRAGVPIVLACVLEGGGIGEVIRVRPGITACLLCSREQLAERGVVDPEPTLDLGYGTGLRHHPMTAVGGDLDIVGKLAARAVVSTLLEGAGFLIERLPADHAVIGLRPPLDRQPEAPFDVERTLQISWHSLGSPAEECLSCGGRG